MLNNPVYRFFQVLNEVDQKTYNLGSEQLDLLHQRNQSRTLTGDLLAFEFERSRRQRLDFQGDDFGVGLPPLSVQ